LIHFPGLSNVGRQGNHGWWGKAREGNIVGTDGNDGQRSHAEKYVILCFNISNSRYLNIETFFGPP
jgi:hypothetical protein